MEIPYLRLHSAFSDPSDRGRLARASFPLIQKGDETVTKVASKVIRSMHSNEENLEQEKQTDNFEKRNGVFIGL